MNNLREKNLTLKIGWKNKKSDSTNVFEAANEKSVKSESNDEELSFLTYRFKRAMKKYGRSRKFKPKDKDEIICYDCKKYGHIREDRPNQEKKEDKTKTFSS